MITNFDHSIQKQTTQNELQKKNQQQAKQYKNFNHVKMQLDPYSKLSIKFQNSCLIPLMFASDTETQTEFQVENDGLTAIFVTD